MPKEEKERIIDAIIFLTCEGVSVKEIAKTLRVNEKAVDIVVSKLEIVRF